MYTLHRFLRMVPLDFTIVLVAFAPFLSGCILLKDVAGEECTAGDGKASVLPEPEEWRVPPPELLPAQQCKKLEAEVYTAKQVYRGYPIVKTVQGYSGDLYDYVQTPPSDVTPLEIPELFANTVLPEGVTLALTELEQYPELWGPTDTQTFKRPDFWRYILEDTGATSVEDWVANHQVPGVPNDPHRMYAGLDVVAPNRGASMRVNQFLPEVEKYTFSLIELSVSCPFMGGREWIGVLLTVDRVNYEADLLSPSNERKLRVRVEHWLEDVNGNLKGGYDFSVGEFREALPLLAQPYVVPTLVPGVIVTPSVPGGTISESGLALIMDPVGNWWPLYNGKALGYYPVENLEALKQGACTVQYYGEVFNPTPEKGWVKTEMGSGQFASGPIGSVAWVREPLYLDMNYAVTIPQNDSFERWSQPYEASCYTRSAMTNPGTLGQYFLLGGPGGKDPGCKQP